MKGSESFIESNFNKIQDLLIESFGVKKRWYQEKQRKPGTHIICKNERISSGAEIKRHELSEASSTSPVTESSIPEISHELKANRPPLRKYIRKVGIPGQQRIVVEVVEQKPNEISIASLKEKFGLSESKIEGIIRDAEKLGKVRRVMNGSYVWT